MEWSYAFAPTWGGGSLPSIAPDGTIYFGRSNHLYALNPDGTLKWTYGPTPNVIWSSPAVANDGTIYVGHNGYTNGNLLAINPDGSLKWSYPAREVRSSPAIAADGTIYVGASDARLYAINPDGSLKWRYRPGFAEAYSSPAIGADGTIYIAGTKERNLHAVNPNGTMKWTCPIGTTGDTVSSPTVDRNGTIYVGGSDNKLYAINPDGTPKWSYTVGYVRSIQSAAIGPDGTVYIISAAGILYAFTPAGDLKWTYTSDAGMVRTTPTVDANGTIYFGGEFNGKIYAINPDGSEKWTFQTPASGVGISTIDSDGTLYVHGKEEFYAVGEVPNTPPTADAGGPYSANEGDTVILDASGSSDPDGNISLYEWDLDNDGEYDDATGVTTEVAFADNGVFTVGLRVTDECNESDTDTAEVTVLNVAPTVDAGAGATINEGNTFSGSGSFTDPGADTWEATVDYGDGSGSQPLTLTDNTFALSHTYADNDVYTVEVCVTDDDEGAGCDSLSVTVNNVAPRPDAGPDQTVYRNDIVTLSGTWTDPASSLDAPYTWSWDLNGDGTPDRDGTASYGDTIIETTSFALEGLYTLTFQVTDKDGGVGSDSLEVQVLNQPPDCSSASPSLDTLWPPNHEFVAIDVLGVTDPEGDPVSITVDSIFQDEPVDAPGSGNTSPDGQGVGTATAEVRAERVGSGNGRVYHISFTADDGHGGICTGEVLVGVPHNKKSDPIDDGPLYDSTVIVP